MIFGQQIARRVVCCLLVLALASCADAEPQNLRAPRPIVSAKPIKTILLVSTVPNSMAMQYGESIYALPRVDQVRWDINGHTLSVLRDYLSQAYTVSTSDLSAASFDRFDFNAGFEELQQALKGKVEAGKYDLILMIAPIAPSGTSSSLLYLPRQRDYEIAFTYILVALDGNTFAVDGIGYAGKDYAMRIKKLRWSGESFSMMNEIDKRVLEPAIYGLIDRNIPHGLEALELR